jgi:hypothetical protein
MSCTACPSETILMNHRQAYDFTTRAPSLLERVVPKSASKNNSFSEAFDLMGYELPPGTIVGTQAWSMHRCASVFPSPEAFLPDWWLGADDGALATMTRNMMPFGTGSRVCGGALHVEDYCCGCSQEF